MTLLSNALARRATLGSRVRRSARTATSALLIAGALGCASEDDLDVEDAANAATADAPVLAQQSGARLAGPNDSYFAEVLTNGSGCPPGSAFTRISADGQVFTTTFSEYEVAVDEDTDISARECQITVRLHSPGGQSYAVHSFYYQGAAYLDEGVSGAQTANYYFQGAPVTARSVRTELVGPRDQSYLFSDDVTTPDEYVWSPCGVDRDLQIVTRLRLENSTPRRSGYMNLSSLDGSTRLEFQLAWKPCQPSGGSTAPQTTTPQQTPSAQQPQTPPTQTPLGGVVDTVGGVVGGVLGGLGGLLGN